MAISDRAEMAERRASSSQTVDIFVALLYNSPCQIKYRWQARVQQHPEALLQVRDHPSQPVSAPTALLLYHAAAPFTSRFAVQVWLSCAVFYLHRRGGSPGPIEYRRQGAGAVTPVPLQRVRDHPPQPVIRRPRSSEYSTVSVLSQGGTPPSALILPQRRGETSPLRRFCGPRVPKSGPPPSGGGRAP